MSRIKASSTKSVLGLISRLNLRFCKHRQLCFKCKALRKFVVGDGKKPRCAQCLLKEETR
jgi:hypothetical protein